MEKTIFYFSATHWDREWYETYQGFRLKLVEVIDALIEQLERDPSLPPFHFDGQTIVFDDYLEVRPECGERLKKLIAQGRILVGPWYCMPDEHLVHGESLIRNLRLGIRKSRALGAEAWRCGYICDIFGHIPQFPQLLNGFSIRSAVLGRGTNECEVPSAFVWQSPDGSCVDVLKVPDRYGYGAYALGVCGQKQIGNRKRPGSEEHVQAVREYIDHEFERAPLPFAVVWDGMDHEPMQTDIPENLEVLRQLYPDCRVETGNLLRLFDEIHAENGSLPVMAGALERPAQAEGPFLHLLIHTLSSRQLIKARNDACENLLLKFLEPFCGYLKAIGQKDYSAFLDVAWRHLLENHPHDSICGCSVDRVHDEMGYRFSQVESICEAIVRRATEGLSGGQFYIPREGGRIALFSPSVLPMHGIQKVEFMLDRDFPTWQEPFGYQELPAFILRDEAGEQVPFVIRRFENDHTIRVLSEKTYRGIRCEVYLPVRFEGREVRRFSVLPSARPERDFGRMATRARVLENAYIRAQVEPDGTVSVEDKITGRIYPSLCQFCDCGEIGDGWNHVSPMKDSIVSGGTVRSISIEHSSSLAGEIRVCKTMNVPEKMLERNERSERSVGLEISIVYSLRRDDRALRVHIDVENTAKDHVLKLMLPLGISAKHFVTGDTYCFVKREAGIDVNTASFKECDHPERFTRGIALVRDKSERGLAFISGGGLHECEYDGEILSVTLFRAFSKTCATNGEIGGQELAPHSYDFTLMPIAADVTNADIQNAQDQLQSPVHAFPIQDWENPIVTSLEGSVCVSSFKDNVLRIYNPNDREEAFVLRDSRGLLSAEVCDLQDEVLYALPLENGELRGKLPAMKLLTIRFGTLEG